MIDFETEEIVPLAAAAKWLPSMRGKAPHVCTLYRWTKAGVKGVRLEIIKIGGTTCTSREALARFFQQLTYGDREPPPPSRFRTPAQRKRDQARAARILDEAGI